MGKNLRRGKMNVILENLKEAERQGHAVNKEKLIAYYCFKFDAARRTIIDYIRACETHAELKIDWVKDETKT